MSRPSAPRLRDLSPTLAVAGLLTAALLAIALIAPARGHAAPASCPTFEVLHNDRIGKVKLAKGTYKVKVLDDELLSCPQASKLFAQFLQDFDGKLPDGWRAKSKAKGAKFSQRRSGAAFRVKRGGGSSGGGGGGGGNQPSGNAVKCPTFQVLHNDEIDGLRFPGGTYQMTALGGLKCSKASDLFAEFLSDDQGSLPGRWRLKAASGTFLRGNGGKGFQVNLWR
ncbi:MAG: hypothetical protein GEU88_11355 [Solirubrobacterales bacterium]|nr:hypothetical protein [Solirubrobacterales bacterium]